MRIGKCIITCVPEKFGEKNVRVGGRCEALLRPSAHTAPAKNDGAAAGNLILPPQPLTMTASAADLVPAVEAYLEANGLKDTLSAMKAEAKAKNMTPSKTVRSRNAPRETSDMMALPPADASSVARESDAPRRRC